MHKRKYNFIRKIISYNNKNDRDIEKRIKNINRKNTELQQSAKIMVLTMKLKNIVSNLNKKK